MGLLFEWDPDKASGNQRKHGVSFDEASTVFSDPLSVTTLDPLHSDEEDRFVIVGISSKVRLVVVSFTDRDDRIRIISARAASKREQKEYEAAS